MSIEQKAEYYDQIYRENENYSKPHTESPYYQLWKRVLQVIPSGINIIDVGCGTGQFAEMLLADRETVYKGIDISSEAIKIATYVLGEDKCEVASAYDYPINPIGSFVVSLETMEHIDDFRFLNNIPLGVEIVFTVPDFNDPAHVRYFKNITEIVFRYHQKINFSHIEKFERWFICKGVIQ